MSDLGGFRKFSSNSFYFKTCSIVILLLFGFNVTRAEDSSKRELESLNLSSNINSNSTVPSTGTDFAYLIKNPATTETSSQVIYSCRPGCECDYKESSLRLQINCSNERGTVPINSSGPAGLNFSKGVRVLKLQGLTLNFKTRSYYIPQLATDTLIELALEDVKVEPDVLFNSPIFLTSVNSLRRFSICRSSYENNGLSLELLEQASQAFAKLKNLDSLTLCDNSPLLSLRVIHILPQVKHVKIFNCSIPYISYQAFSHLTSLQSLNLSHNEIINIPNGLMDNLAELTSLDFSYNLLAHLQEEVFSGLKSLRKVDLSHNKIQYVDAEVFTQLKDLQAIDLSNNEVIQFFEPYFKNNKNLRTLNMSNTWVANTFNDESTAERTFREMDRLISTLKRVELLDLSDNQMTIIPETLSHSLRLSHVYLGGNLWSCTCDDRWVLDWISTTNVTLDEGLTCFQKSDRQQSPLQPFLRNLTRHCNNSNIFARTPFKYYALIGKEKLLNCHTRTPPLPNITWITPKKEQLTLGINSNSSALNDSKVYNDGALYIKQVTSKDFGLYLCIASYQDLNITHYVHLGVDVSIFKEVRMMSIVVGLLTSFGFLTLVLLAQAIRALLIRSGVKCITMRTARQTRRVRAFFESLEQHKNSQLEWLRQNYNDQAKKIQENCISQLERLRDSYTNQTKNLSEFREYSAQQLVTLRDQYHDQVRKVASFSSYRLGKVRENYVFNRNRVCRFSSHQFVRLREVYKWQAQTLNKILENLPQGLNLDVCRGVGSCGRVDSIYLDQASDIVGSSFNNMHLGQGDIPDDKLEHISLLIPPEFLLQYLNPVIELDQGPSTSTAQNEMDVVSAASIVRGNADTEAEDSDADNRPGPSYRRVEVELSSNSYNQDIEMDDIDSISD